MFDIIEYCENCKKRIVKPIHSECYRTCKYSTVNQELKGEYKIIDLNDKGKWNVYFIKCLDYIKIGRTYDIAKRLEIFYRDNPIDVSVILLLKNVPDLLEPALHKYFSNYNYKREWFFYVGKLKRFINLSKEDVILKLRKMIYDIDFIDRDLTFIDAED